MADQWPDDERDEPIDLDGDHGEELGLEDPTGPDYSADDTAAGGEELEPGFVDEDARGHDVMDEKAANAIGEQLVTGLAAKASDEFRRDLENRVLKPWPVKLVRSRIERKATSSDDDWLDRLGPWIPKTWREGWFHDILEDRENWRAEGLSRPRRELRTIVQFTNAMIFNPRTWFVGAITWIASRIPQWPWLGR